MPIPASDNRFRSACCRPSWQVYVVILSMLGCLSDAARARTDSPVHYFTWSGFPVLSFRESDNLLSVTESPSRPASKPFHFPIPFTFNGKPTYVVHVNQALKDPKQRLTSSADVTTTTLSSDTHPKNNSSTAHLQNFDLEAKSSADSASTLTNRTQELKDTVLQSRVSPNILKLHNTFVGNGRPHSFFVLKAPGGRNRKSSRRRNKPKNNVRRVVLKS